MSSDRRWSKFWWEDYEGDPLLSACSLAAQGLWMRMLCLMHRGNPYGHLVINGNRPSTRLLGSIMRCSEKEMVKLTAELEEHGVFSRLDDGTIFSRRMVKDAERSEDGREAVARRWGNSGTGGNGCRDPNTPPNRSPSTKPTTDPNSESVGGQLHQEARGKKLEAEESSLRSLSGRVSPRACGQSSRQVGMLPEQREKDAAFERFWLLYPRKVGKGQARKAYLSALSVKDVSTDTIMLALHSAKWPSNPKFIPHPATWLNGERWLDEVDTRDPVLVAAGFYDDEPANPSRPRLLS